jgi:hypothetical protein
MQRFKKVSVTKKEKNRLLQTVPNAQNVDVYIRGEITLHKYVFGDTGRVYFNNHALPECKEVMYLDDFHAVLCREYDKCFLHLVGMKQSSWFVSQRE